MLSSSVMLWEPTWLRSLMALISIIGLSRNFWKRTAKLRQRSPTLTQKHPNLIINTGWELGTLATTVSMFLVPGCGSTGIQLLNGLIGLMMNLTTSMDRTV